MSPLQNFFELVRDYELGAVRLAIDAKLHMEVLDQQRHSGLRTRAVWVFKTAAENRRGV